MDVEGCPVMLITEVVENLEGETVIVRLVGLGFFGGIG